MTHAQCPKLTFNLSFEWAASSLLLLPTQGCSHTGSLGIPTNARLSRGWALKELQAQVSLITEACENAEPTNSSQHPIRHQSCFSGQPSSNLILVFHLKFNIGLLEESQGGNKGLTEPTGADVLDARLHAGAEALVRWIICAVGKEGFGRHEAIGGHTLELPRLLVHQSHGPARVSVQKEQGLANSSPAQQWVLILAG